MTSDLQEAEVLGAEVDPGAEEGAGAEGGLAGLHQGGLLAGFFMLMSFSMVICMPVLIFAFLLPKFKIHNLKTSKYLYNLTFRKIVKIW